jgi:alcohol dehydrogenase|tara:strand:- start:227 stop:1417 length:1191 start_codon:yes stop_codon:yes gene_type:complete
MSNKVIPEHASALSVFDNIKRTKLVFGDGVSLASGELAKELGLKHVLLVTDRGLVEAGHVEVVRDSLSKAGIKVTLFDQVIENPTTDCVEKAKQAASEARVDSFIGLGGGSSMDTAKGANFLLTNGGRMHDYWGVNKATKEMLPLIVIPTTAGTGSECQSFALISDSKTHQKMACGDSKAAAKIAILDPGLTLSQPENVTVCTGIDAIAHAVETAVTNKRNKLSTLFSEESFKLLLPNFTKVLNQPNDISARGSMLLGAAMAGCAIEASMLGAAHSLANPLTAHYNIVHGQAVGMMLPYVVRFNSEIEECRGVYVNLMKVAQIECENESADEVNNLVAYLLNLLQQTGLPIRLRDVIADKSELKVLAKEASAQWTAGFNPRSVGEIEMEKIYIDAY